MVTKVRLLLDEVGTSQYTSANILIALNSYYDDLITMAIQESGEWECQGEVATANLVASQQEYTLPTDLLSIKRVEANYTGNDQGWTNLPVLDMRNLESPLSNDTIDGSSYYCRIYDNSIFLQNPVETAVSSGLKVYYSNEATALSADADTPNLPNQLHIGLVYGACMDYSMQKEQHKRVKMFKELYDEIQGKTIKYYTNRLVAVRPQLKPHTERMD